MEGGFRLSGVLHGLYDERGEDSLIGDNKTYSILVLGDSISYGDTSWPKQLEDILNNNSDGRYFKVYNKARPGASSTGIASSAKYYVDKYHPEMVLVMMGALDSEELGDEKHPFLTEVRSFLKDLRLSKFVIVILDSLIKDDKNKENQNLLSLGRDEYVRENYLEATELINRVLDVDPVNQDGYYLLGLISLAQNDSKNAEKRFKKVIIIDSKNTSAYLQLGKLYREQERYDEAIEEFQKAVVVDPANVDASFELVLSYVDAGKEKEIGVERQRFFKNLNGTLLVPSDYFNQAIVLYQNKDLRGAEVAAKEAVIVNPLDTKGYIILGEIYHQKGLVDKHQFLEAEKIFKRALRFEADFPSALRGLGLVLFYQKKYAEAIAVFEEVVRKVPEDRSVYYNLGYSYWKLNRTDDAIKATTRSIEIDSKYLSSYFQLATLFQEQNRLKEATSLMENLLANDPPRQEQINLILGKIFFQEGRVPEAERAWRTALSVNQNFKEGYVELGLLYVTTERASQAKDLLDNLKGNNLPLVEQVSAEIWNRLQMEGKIKEADQLFPEMSLGKARLLLPDTQTSYNNVYDLFRERGVHFVVVQYPTLSLGPLEQLFKGKKDVLLISNVENFRKAFQNRKYNDLFQDQAHVSFGHLTEEGSYLIAREVARTLQN